ncbi:hypothetical protein I4641_10320 [Waterburya agarophytonicola K14]|uniref:NIDO domain-containing protein n=1 Tax=Waterburya agarophytonicola KI4 TaxID=2874699 RepID=A0A964FF46_9CYAN|nr:nidogen-like domain-containing protein [Waterburya agarophytonicola]MCC0177370.1 hypothetical protein [Waterburya agarophytonicola KI4]
MQISEHNKMQDRYSSLPFDSDDSNETHSFQLGLTKILAQNSLQQFAVSPSFDTDLQLAFGNNIAVDSLQTSWVDGEFVFPEIEVVNSAEINYARGAFAQENSTIYLAQEFLASNQNNPDVVTNVLLEEYGHFVDSQLNLDDSSGDEGAIFAALVLEEDPTNTELQQLQNEDDTAIVTINGRAIEIEQSFTNLINGLGGESGFGEDFIERNDDGSSSFINITSIFEDGINFFGDIYQGFYINNNGNITFDSSLATFTPTDLTSYKIIAPFFADVDTREDNIETSEGGNSTGTNLVYYDFDTEADAITITWDDVGKFSNQTTPNAFQLILKDLGNQNFKIEFRYEEIQWTVGGASEDVYARVGLSAGNGSDFLELPFSNNLEMLLNLEAGTNINSPGRFVFSVIDGEPDVGTFSLMPTDSLHRFYQYEKGYHLYTSDESEIQVINGRGAAAREGYEYQYEYEKFTVLTDDKDLLTGETIEGVKPIYRFFNTDTGEHLYTIDEEEKNNIIDNLNNYTFEGAKFYAFDSPLENFETLPVYRMLNGQSGSHLYTSDLNEINYIDNNLSHFSMENDGEAVFYVFEL